MEQGIIAIYDDQRNMVTYNAAETAAAYAESRLQGVIDENVYELGLRTVNLEERAKVYVDNGLHAVYAQSTAEAVRIFQQFDRLSQARDSSVLVTAVNQAGQNTQAAVTTATNESQDAVKQMLHHMKKELERHIDQVKRSSAHAEMQAKDNLVALDVMQRTVTSHTTAVERAQRQLTWLEELNMDTTKSLRDDVTTLRKTVQAAPTEQQIAEMVDEAKQVTSVITKRDLALQRTRMEGDLTEELNTRDERLNKEMNTRDERLNKKLKTFSAEVKADLIKSAADNAQQFAQLMNEIKKLHSQQHLSKTTTTQARSHHVNHDDAEEDSEYYGGDDDDDDDDVDANSSRSTNTAGKADDANTNYAQSKLNREQRNVLADQATDLSDEEMCRKMLKRDKKRFTKTPKEMRFSVPYYALQMEHHTFMHVWDAKLSGSITKPNTRDTSEATAIKKTMSYLHRAYNAAKSGKTHAAQMAVEHALQQQIKEAMKLRIRADPVVKNKGPALSHYDEQEKQSYNNSKKRSDVFMTPEELYDETRSNAKFHVASRK